MEGAHTGDSGYGFTEVYVNRDTEGGTDERESEDAGDTLDNG